MPEVADFVSLCYRRQNHEVFPQNTRYLLYGLNSKNYAQAPGLIAIPRVQKYKAAPRGFKSDTETERVISKSTVINNDQNWC